MKRVLLLHDIAESERIGMLERGSRYLLSLETIKEGIAEAQSRMVRFERIEEVLNEEISQSNYVSISVDDGGGSSLCMGEYFAKQGIKAYFFVVSQFIGMDGFLEIDEIRALQSMGHKIGAHSHTHPNPFCELSKEQTFKEVLKCKLILEEILGNEVDSFSVPGGNVRKETLRRLQDSSLGLKEVYTSTPFQGDYAGTSETRIYGRVCIEANMNANAIARFCQGRGWSRALINYQIRRLRRELIYRTSYKGNATR